MRSSPQNERFRLFFSIHTQVGRQNDVLEACRELSHQIQQARTATALERRTASAWEGNAADASVGRLGSVDADAGGSLAALSRISVKVRVVDESRSNWTESCNHKTKVG